MGNWGMLACAVGLVVTCACGTSTAKPTAAEVCAKLEAAGIAKGCVEEKPTVINARASKMVAFDLVGTPGKRGHVLSFAAVDDYAATVEAYKAAAMLAGPHRYGSEKALIFVQFNDGASLDTGARAKSLVDGL